MRLIRTNGALVDTIYVDNAAKAHLLAWIIYEQGTCAGKIYFISQDDPVEINSFINRILMSAGLPPAKKYVSAKTALP